MLYISEYEINDAVFRYENRPTLAAATKTLQNLARCANQNSDGWAYWPKPCRAAKQLQELISEAQRAVYQYNPDYTDPTPAQVRKAYTPIKAFLTRSGLSCEIVDPS